MSSEAGIDRLLAALRAPETQPDRLLAVLKATRIDRPKVQRLAYGQTRRSPGYVSEAEYLESQRRPSDMRINPKGRRTYLRFDHRPELGYRSAQAEYQRATAKLAELVAPNIILGS